MPKKTPGSPDGALQSSVEFTSMAEMTRNFVMYAINRLLHRPPTCWKEGDTFSSLGITQAQKKNLLQEVCAAYPAYYKPRDVSTEAVNTLEEAVDYLRGC